MILSWLDLIFQFGLVADDIQLSSWQWPVYKKLYPACVACTRNVTLPPLCRMGIGVLLILPCLLSLPSTTYYSATRVQCPASSGATDEDPNYSDLE